MNLTKKIASQFREVHLNGKWIALTNIKQGLREVTWKEATTQIGSLNTIAALAFHINYYIAGLVKVLEGGPLDIKDKYSFDMPPIQSQADWEELLDKMWKDAERFAYLIEQMPEENLFGPFVEEKYGNYYRNLYGMIEHCYYHLGQIVLIRKLLKEKVS